MFLAWSLGCLSVAGYAFVGATWQAVGVAALSGGSLAIGTILWSTTMQERVPGSLLGRVASLDWLLAVGLTPISFALVAPLAGWLGREATLIGAGAIGCASVLSLYAVGQSVTRRGADTPTTIGAPGES